MIYKISIIFLINLIVFYFEHKFRRVARLSESAVREFKFWLHTFGYIHDM